MINQPVRHCRAAERTQQQSDDTRQVLHKQLLHKQSTAKAHMHLSKLDGLALQGDPVVHSVLLIVHLQCWWGGVGG
jgi:hypothetical protein